MPVSGIATAAEQRVWAASELAAQTPDNRTCGFGWLRAQHHAVRRRGFRRAAADRLCATLAPVHFCCCGLGSGAVAPLGGGGCRGACGCGGQKGLALGCAHVSILSGFEGFAVSGRGDLACPVPCLRAAVVYFFRYGVFAARSCAVAVFVSVGMETVLVAETTSEAAAFGMAVVVGLLAARLPRICRCYLRAHCLYE